MFPEAQRDSPLLQRWLHGTTCADYRIHRSILFENPEFIVLKHNSHSSWGGRFCGHRTCPAYAALYRKADLLPGSKALQYGEGAIRRWEGRIGLKKLAAECAALGAHFGAADPQVSQPAPDAPCGDQLRPLSPHAREALCSLAQAPVPSQTFNPGVVDRLLRGALAELVDLPSPFKTHKGRMIAHLRITPTGLQASCKNIGP